MKRMTSLIYTSVIPSFLITVFLGTVYGASMTMQREGGLQNGQESTVAKDDVYRDGSQLTFSPLRLKNKSDSGRESGADSPSVKMERYKPYQKGEGERKIR
ncbi:MAG: hypothetical protein C0390_01160 [Syntrophus sp. (in: bacteria)]|nr:hypothetical protein [Syntrophus sp. (in: bacteria)]